MKPAHMKPQVFWWHMNQCAHTVLALHCRRILILHDCLHSCNVRNSAVESLSCSCQQMIFKAQDSVGSPPLQVQMNYDAFPMTHFFGFISSILYRTVLLIVSWKPVSIFVNTWHHNLFGSNPDSGYCIWYNNMNTVSFQLSSNSRDTVRFRCTLTHCMNKGWDQSPHNKDNWWLST